MPEKSKKVKLQDPADKIEDSNRRYLNSEKGRTALQRYQQSEKGKEARKRYLESDKGKTALLRYYNSEKAKANRKKNEELRNLGVRYQAWLETNPGKPFKTFLLTLKEH